VCGVSPHDPPAECVSVVLKLELKLERGKRWCCSVIHRGAAAARLRCTGIRAFARLRRVESREADAARGAANSLR